MSFLTPVNGQRLRADPDPRRPEPAVALPLLSGREYSYADADFLCRLRLAGSAPTRRNALLAAAQIDRANVAKLQTAWTYHTGALDTPGEANGKVAFESTPILVDGVLYLSTPFNAVIALDPATGREKWKYDPKLDHRRTTRRWHRAAYRRGRARAAHR